MVLTKEQRLFKTLLCLCDFCNGYGIVLVNFPFYKKYKTFCYEECLKCKGTGFKKNYWKAKKIFIKKLVYSNNGNFDAKQIRGLSKESLMNFYNNKKLSVKKISKLINISESTIYQRLKLYEIKSHRLKKDEKIMIDDLRKYVKKHYRLPFNSYKGIKLNNFSHSYMTYRRHFGSIKDIQSKCGIKKSEKMINGSYQWKIIKL